MDQAVVVPLTAGIFTIIGAAIGAGSTILNSRLTGSRERRTRLRAERMEALKDLYRHLEILGRANHPLAPDRERLSSAAHEFEVATWLVSSYFPEETKSGTSFAEKRGKVLTYRSFSDGRLEIEFNREAFDDVKRAITSLASRVVST